MIKKKFLLYVVKGFLRPLHIKHARRVFCSKNYYFFCKISHKFIPIKGISLIDKRITFTLIIWFKGL